ncbi:hypothetical protein M0R45_015219 [Rubus argutus]|uniref:Uncharacterized protein n=1 Tax=Rubus argutus TaxID=59490 RepID=A0AAW1XQ54_RUBAR
MLFLKPESLKQYVGKMDEEIRKHLEVHWHGKQQVTVSHALMKKLTFNIICSLLFGLERGTRRDEFVEGFQKLGRRSVVSAYQLALHALQRQLQGKAGEIARSKLSREFLTWEDLGKMKYTWSVAQEILRMTSSCLWWLQECSTSKHLFRPTALYLSEEDLEYVQELSFTRIETLIAMHHVVTQFTWKLCADNLFNRDPALVPTRGLPIEIMPRTPL